MKLINADAFKKEIKSDVDLGQWDAQEVIKIIDDFPEVSVSTMSVKSGDIIVANFYDIFPDDMEVVMHKLKQIFPDNEVICIEDADINTQCPEDVIECLENMIKKLKGEDS